MDGQTPPATATSNPSLGKNLLIIEDDFYIRDLYTMQAKQEGFNVIEAGNGVEALKKLEGSPPDMILLDIMLPDMNGMEILKKIKASAQLKHIPVIVATNLDDSATALEAETAGADGFLLKAQSTPNQIIQTVKKFVNAPK